MRERGILFSAPMVRALLAGTKTQTRRVVAGVDDLRPTAKASGVSVLPGADRCSVWFGWPVDKETNGGTTDVLCPYGKPGDRLWVRETWKPSIAHSCAMDTCDCGDVNVVYQADGERAWFRDGDIPDEWTMPLAAQKKRNVPAIHMPRWASRILLEVTEVRVERLQAISEADALAEGIEAMRCRDCHLAAYGLPGWGHDELNPSAKEAYQRLWESINGLGSWDANPWVWAVSFRRVSCH